MPEIIVNINDQDYAIVCDPGEENHLKHLSSKIDYKVRELTKRFGKIGETRLMVMASLLIADEIHELNKKLETNIEKINSLEANIGSKDKELTDQKKESQEYIDISNDRLSDLLSARRSRTIARPRQIAMYLSKILTTRSLPEIGRKFGGRDHTTVIHAVKKIEDLRVGDVAIDEEVEVLRRSLEN